MATTCTTSASSPCPLSPSRTSPHPQPCVHNASDEDEERHQRAMLSPYDELELTPGEPHTSSTDLATDFEVSSYPQESWPHIPLWPLHNQVGGHSAIYKFTKRAVCKVSPNSRIRQFNLSSRVSQPLVSRENLFYKSVEREAPPLLDFIPCYLGVMLVSYRRVPKSASVSPQIPSATKSLGIASDSAVPRLILLKSASDRRPDADELRFSLLRGAGACHLRRLVRWFCCRHLVMWSYPVRYARWLPPLR